MIIPFFTFWDVATSPRFLLLKFPHQLVLYTEYRNNLIEVIEQASSHSRLNNVSFSFVSSKLRQRQRKQILAAISIFLSILAQIFVLSDYLIYARLDTCTKYQWRIADFRREIGSNKFAMVKTRCLLIDLLHTT